MAYLIRHFQALGSDAVSIEHQFQDKTLNAIKGKVIKVGDSTFYR